MKDMLSFVREQLLLFVQDLITTSQTSYIGKEKDLGNVQKTIK